MRIDCTPRASLCSLSYCRWYDPATQAKTISNELYIKTPEWYRHLARPPALSSHQLQMISLKWNLITSLPGFRYFKVTQQFAHGINRDSETKSDWTSPPHTTFGTFWRFLNINLEPGRGGHTCNPRSFYMIPKEEGVKLRQPRLCHESPSQQ